jgi:glycosyltransferase involved in cell wall biosynthesis
MTKLSICIATYNRATYIGETLESIIPQLTTEVELLVVDGASTDNTESVVTEYVRKCNSIRYIRLPAKGGVDQDYNKAVELARGEMCWLFTDDDLLKKGAVNSVLAEAKKGYSLIVVNAEVKNKDFSKVITDKKLPIDENKIFDKSDFNSLFQSTIPYLSFIGGVVINRDLWMLREKISYYGSEFIHLGVIFQAPLPGPALILAEPYITIRFGNAQWTSRGLEIWMFKWPNLICSFEHLQEHIKKDYRNKKSLRRLKDIIIYRAEKVYTLTEYRKWFVVENTPFWWKIAIWCVAIIPHSLFRFIIISYLRMVNKKALDEWR